MSISMQGIKRTEQGKLNISKGKKEKPWTEVRRQAQINKRVI
jgi:hypothetical protein